MSQENNSNGEQPSLNITLQQNENVTPEADNVHPHHWCGQHKFEINSPTNVYNYSNIKSKEKSAMCRIAEIARYNKLKHVYDLQDESGPAHKKLFTVRLILTPGEFFEGSGTSIKRAQQASAEIALKNTKLPLPMEKQVKRKNSEMTKPHRILQNVCRTLQYASPHYISCNPPVYPDPGCPVPEHILLPPAAVAMYGTPFASIPIDPSRPHGPKLQAVIVNINGKSIATGIGETYPLAKQDAALKTLSVLSPLLKDYNVLNEKNQSVCRVLTNENNQENIPVHKQKSVISDIHEKAHQLKMNVVFETLKEEGPPHDRLYVVRCAFITSLNVVKAEAVGKGRKKKFAQQEACKELLNNIKSSEPEEDFVTLASNVCKTQKKFAAINREPKRKTIVKDKKMDPLYGHQINPVSRLIQISQIKNQPHPTFQLLSENGLSKYKEFVVQVQYGQEIQEGKGPNKRLAKRAAAEAMLEAIGYIKPLPAPGKSLLKKCNESFSDNHSTMMLDMKIAKKSSPSGELTEVQHTDHEEIECPDISNQVLSETEKRHVTFNSEVQACPPPGDSDYPKSIITLLKKDTVIEGKTKRPKRTKENRRCLSVEQFEELSRRAEKCVQEIESVSDSNQGTITAQFSLDQLSVIFKFSVQYTTFPEASPSQHFTIVSLGLEEPLVGHGTGSSVGVADEKAALAALHKLKEIKSNKPF